MMHIACHDIQPLCVECTQHGLKLIKLDDNHIVDEIETNRWNLAIWKIFCQYENVDHME
jgi:hypothetical protein